MAGKIKREDTSYELESAMKQSLLDLKNDAQRYDEGEFLAIMRSSVTLRTLFYNKSYSPSMFNLLSNKHRFKFPTFTEEITKDDFLNFGCMYLIMTKINNKKIYTLTLSDKEKEKKKLSFHDWWEKQIIFKTEHQTFTRKDLVLKQANQDGIAHFDLKIDKKYYFLKKGKSLINVNVNLPITSEIDDNTIKYANLGLTRQIVHEVLLTFNDYFNLNYNPNLEKNTTSPTNLMGVYIKIGKIKRNFSRHFMITHGISYCDGALRHLILNN